MPKARSKDPLLAATTSILLPAVKPFGFQRKGSRDLVRICDDILHVIGPWYSGWGSRNFYVECYVMPLVPVTDGLYLTWGERLCDESTSNVSWPGQSHEVTDASLERVVQQMYKQVLPSYYQQLETTEAFLAFIKHKRPDPDHHMRFQRACCLVKLQRLDEARSELNLAIRQYMDDGRSWCFPKAAQCEQMLKAIDEGKSLELYQQWKMETIRNLKLEKIILHGIAI